jgi:hypothetical protein
MMTVICDPDQAIVRPAVTYGKNVIYALARMAWPASGLPPVSQTPSLGVMMEREVRHGAKMARTGVQA